MARVIAADPVQHHRAVVGDAARMVADEQRRAIVRDVLDAEQAHAEVARPEELQQRRRAFDERRVEAAVRQILRALGVLAVRRADRLGDRGERGADVRRQRSPREPPSASNTATKSAGGAARPVQRHARDGVGEAEPRRVQHQRAARTVAVRPARSKSRM